MKKRNAGKKLFRSGCLALAACLLLSGCGSTASKEPEKPADPSVSDVVAEERIDLNIIGVENNYGNIGYVEGTPVWNELQDQANVNLTITPMDRDKWNVTMAGGDTTDIIAFDMSKDLSTLVKSELILPLNALLDAYGQNITETGADALRASADRLGEDNDTVYAIPISYGPDGGNPKPTNSALYTRWDLYKELGAPVIHNMDEYAEILAKMVAMEPTTADGLPVYGVSLYTEDSGFYAVNRYARCLGYEMYNDWVSTRISDSTMCYAYTDEDSPFWQSLAFCQKAYALGILDPDSFTQKIEDVWTKGDNGQLLTPVWGNGILDSSGYEVLPMEGSYILENKNSVTGNTYGLAIAATCKNPERAMQFLNYLYAPETARLIYSGIEGEHWSVVDGVPTPNDETIALRKQGGDEFFATGVNSNVLYGIVGRSRGTILDDGYPADLYRSASYFPKALNDYDIDFCAYYGDYAYPNEVLLDNGTKDASALDVRISNGYGQASEDIQRIDARLMELAQRLMPQIVMTNSEEEFQEMKAAAIVKFNEEGAEESRAWWQSRWDALNEKYN